MLDNLISWNEVVHMMEDSGAETAKLLEKVRNALVFRRLPLETVEPAFQKIQTQAVKAGEYAIQQGEAA